MKFKTCPHCYKDYKSQGYKAHLETHKMTTLYENVLTSFIKTLLSIFLLIITLGLVSSFLYVNGGLFKIVSYTGQFMYGIGARICRASSWCRFGDGDPVADSKRFFTFSFSHDFHDELNDDLTMETLEYEYDTCDDAICRDHKTGEMEALK
jgi:hypothetical protein